MSTKGLLRYVILHLGLTNKYLKSTGYLVTYCYRHTRSRRQFLSLSSFSFSGLAPPSAIDFGGGGAVGAEIESQIGPNARLTSAACASLRLLPVRQPIVYRLQERRSVAGDECLKVGHVCCGNLES